MGWLLSCAGNCAGRDSVANIVDLIHHHCGADGWFICTTCRSRAYIERSFELQEGGEKWDPQLRGIVPLGHSDETYQPFVFLAGYRNDPEVMDVWFAYYKDLRSKGGKLKMGHGPGGPPVLDKSQVLKLIGDLVKRGVVSRDEVMSQL